jgi:hypothetical protein
MRFPESKIKEAILHPDIEIRDRAARYFAESHSDDDSIMAQVIKAVGTYGREGAYRLIGSSRHVAQSAECIAWVIGELNDDESNRHENYTYNLSMVLLEADPFLLLPSEESILDSRHFHSPLRPAFIERLRMLSWDEETCWRELEQFCEEGKDRQYGSEIDLPHAHRIVEALARFGNALEEKVHRLLGQTIEDYTENPMAWMQPLVARLAGEARLHSTVPLLITKLQADEGDVLNQECAGALTRIGTLAVLHSVAEAFPNAGRRFRNYATEPLQNIRSDLAVETCLRLLDQERDALIQTMLAEALLSQLAVDGIEAARRLLVGRKLDFEAREMRAYLLETCTLTGERFPEYDAWLAAEKADKEEHWRRMKELEGDPTRMMIYALEKLSGKKAPAAVWTKPAEPATTRLAEPRQSRKRQKIGRNDRCPCGSGKKFKVCCGR